MDKNYILATYQFDWPLPPGADGGGGSPILPVAIELEKALLEAFIVHHQENRDPNRPEFSEIRSHDIEVRRTVTSAPLAVWRIKVNFLLTVTTPNDLLSLLVSTHLASMLSGFSTAAADVARSLEPRLIDARSFVNLIQDEHEVGKFITNPTGA